MNNANKATTWYLFIFIKTVQVLPITTTLRVVMLKMLEMLFKRL